MTGIYQPFITFLGFLIYPFSEVEGASFMSEHISNSMKLDLTLNRFYSIALHSLQSTLFPNPQGLIGSNT
jgi:hypothetical protein